MIEIAKLRNSSILSLHLKASKQQKPPLFQRQHPTTRNMKLLFFLLWPCIEISVADPGCLSRIRIFSILEAHKSCSKLSELWSRLIIPDPAPDFLPSRIQGSKRPRIRVPNIGWNMLKLFLMWFVIVFFSCVQGWDWGTPFPIRLAAGLHPEVWAGSSLVLTSRRRYRTVLKMMFGGFFPNPSWWILPELRVRIHNRHRSSLNFIQLFNVRANFNNKVHILALVQIVLTMSTRYYMVTVPDVLT